MIQKLRELLEKLKQRWLALTQRQKVLLVIAAAAVLAALFYTVVLTTRPNYVPLFSKLEPQEAGNIVEKLKGMGVQYRLADGGKTIEVPEEQVYDVRIQLASSGVLAGGAKGFELFDQNRLGVTDFEQQVDYQRALQEELRRTIVQLDEVEQARVHLVIPQKSVFVEDTISPSASIALKLKPSAELKPEQIRGIIDLVVGSVEGMKPEDVHIIDTRGNILSDHAGVGDEQVNATQATLKQQQVKRAYEKELEKRVQQMLERILGPGRAVVMVTADLDFNQQQSKSTTYSDGPVVSEQTNSEKSSGISGTGGVPGTGSNLQNVPTYPGVAGSGTQQSQTKESIVKNYQVSSQEQTVVQAPGTLRRLSTSVAVNGNLTATMKKQIFDVVASGVGYDATRNDQIAVQSMAFDTSYQKQVESEMAAAEAKAKEEQRRKTLLYFGIAAGILLLAGILFIILYRRAMARKSQRLDKLLEASEPVSIKELEEDDESNNKLYDSKQNEIRAYAKSRPQDVADILRIWLSGR